MRFHTRFPFRTGSVGLAPLAAVIALLASQPAAAQPRGDVLERMAVLLEARYVDEAHGSELAKMLRSSRESGRFDTLSDPVGFARAVGAALRETVDDLHLQVTYEPDREFVPGLTRDQNVRRIDDSGAVRQVVRTGRIDARDAEAIARTNYGVERVELLPGNVGYLKISQFVPLSLSRDALREAFTRLEESDAVIIDLRGTPGGHPETVGHVLSAFFASNRGDVPLHISENRALGMRSEVRTDPALSRPRLAAAPLFVLVDATTASAAEMFAYAARNAGRAQLVGEITRGAGNGASRHSVGAGFALLVPEWRVLSGPGWEGVGVRPDIETTSVQALDKALELARAL